MRVLLSILAALSLAGCCLVRDGGEPVVSPTTISTEEQDGDAPSFPHNIPWWVEEN